MGSEQDVDVKSEAESVEEKSSEETQDRPRRLEGLRGVAATLKEPKPQHTCGVEPPPKNTSGGAVPVPDEPKQPAPQFQCGIMRPPVNTSGGEKKQ